MLANVPVIYLGHRLADRPSTKAVHALAAIIFGVLGALTLRTALFPEAHLMFREIWSELVINSAASAGIQTRFGNACAVCDSWSMTVPWSKADLTSIATIGWYGSVVADHDRRQTPTRCCEDWRGALCRWCLISAIRVCAAARASPSGRYGPSRASARASGQARPAETLRGPTN
jgi:hypothetical protein